MKFRRVVLSLSHVDFSLREGDFDVGLVEGFFEVFLSVKEDSPVVVWVGPDVDGEVY